MRKGHLDIINRAKRSKYIVDEEIQFLSNLDENIPLYIIRQIFNYLINEKRLSKHSSQDILNEIIRCLKLYHPENDNYNFAINAIFPYNYYESDKLFGSDIKNEIAEQNYKLYQPFEARLDIELIKTRMPESMQLYIKEKVKNIEVLETTIEKFLDNEIFLNDAINNKEKSFLYYCLNNSLNIEYSSSFLKDIEPIYEIISTALKNDQSLYKLGYFQYVKQENICLGRKFTYLKIDLKKLQEYIISMNPVINSIVKATENIFTKKENCYFYDEYIGQSDIDKKYYKIGNMLNPGQKCTIDENIEKITVTIKKKCIVVSLQKFKSIIVQKSENILPTNSKTYNFIIFYDGKIYQEIKKRNENKKTIPLSMKTLKYICNNSPLFAKYIKEIAKNLEETYYIIKNIKEDFKLAWLIPCSVNELLTYKNKKQLFYTKYKDAKNLNINYNKENINLAYLIIKSYKYIDNDDVGRLCNIKLINENEIFDYKKQYFITKSQLKNLQTYNNKILKNMFLATIIKNHIENNKFQNFLFTDYIDMSLLLKDKISLKITSIKKIIEKHDDLSKKFTLKKTPLIHIPKDTKFLPLSKILPKEFEWIKTKKRLVQEGVSQNHCVATYASYINSDICAIYSFYDKTGEYSIDNIPQRYTLEFQKNKKGYVVNQIQGYHNQVDCSKMYDYVLSFIDN